MKTDYPFYEIKHELHTVKDLIYVVTKTYAYNPVFRYKEGGRIVEKDKESFIRDVDQIGMLFHLLFEQGSHIAVLGGTSYVWLCCYFATMLSENVAVPLDRQLPKEEILEQLNFADTICLLYDAAYQETAEYIAGEAGGTIRCICMQASEKENLPELLKMRTREVTWTGMPKSEDVAEIVFTSGTTGKGKGCMITHGNLAWNAMNGSSYTYLTTEDSTMSILPINHALEVTAGIMTPLCCGVTICINDSLKYMGRNLLLYRPQCMIVVPLVVETLYKNIWREIEKTGQKKKIEYAMKLVSLLYRFRMDIRRKVFAPILEQLGGNLRLLVGGGAYMDPAMIKAFEIWGINIVQGYGVTECAPVIACNTDRYKKYDSVGKVVNGCEVKIADGEIWVRGPIVMKGYYKEPELTQEAMDGEWFKTGDLGYLDKDNFLYITGRKKNLIILSNGENVSPEELEQKLLQIPGIEEAIVYEEKGKLKAECYPGEGKEDLAEEVKKQVEELNLSLPNYKRIWDIVVRREPFPKTTTRKIKRYEAGVKDI